jgi:hypothetical protein
MRTNVDLSTRRFCIGHGSDDDNEIIVEINGRFFPPLHAMNDSDETDFITHGSNE